MRLVTKAGPSVLTGLSTAPPLPRPLSCSISHSSKHDYKGMALGFLCAVFKLVLVPASKEGRGFQTRRSAWLRDGPKVPARSPG